MQINIHTPIEYQHHPRLEYVIQFIQLHPLCPNGVQLTLNKPTTNSISINYGKNEKNNASFNIPSQSFFFKQDSIFFSNQYFLNTYYFNQQYFYGVERNEKSGIFFQNNSFQYDVFESIFFFISRYEEFYAPENENNNAGWLDEKYQILIKNKLNEIPIVDQLIQKFFEIVLNIEINKKTTFDMTHDLDIMYRFNNKVSYFKSLAANIYYQRGVWEFFQIIFYGIKSIFHKMKDPYDTFNEMLLSDNLFIRKILFLMSGGNSKFDNLYDIHHPYIKKIIELAKNKGYKIGIHPSYNAGFDEEMYIRELKLLEQITEMKIDQNRQHWLRYDWRFTPIIWGKNGVKNDFTIGYNQHIGFRCGTGFPYFMYDFKNEKKYDWQEIPLVIMDSSVKHFVRKNGGSIRTVVLLFLSKNKYNTHISMNFHNSNFDFLTKEGLKINELYQSVLKEIDIK